MIIICITIGIISSNYDIGIKMHPLTQKGREQAESSADQLYQLINEQLHSKEERIKPDMNNIVFISSPFIRAYQTAQVCLHSFQDLVKVSSYH